MRVHVAQVATVKVECLRSETYNAQLNYERDADATSFEELRVRHVQMRALPRYPSSDVGICRHMR